ncbi:MAG TPA: iron-sulfur cluster assembly accessory protein [Actinomycetota bacterium]
MQLTETAASKLKYLMQEQGHPDAALRIAAEPGGCCGYRYSMALVEADQAGDLFEEHHGVRVVTDPESAPRLADARIDFVDSLSETGFAIHNPSAPRHEHEHEREHGNGGGGGCACGGHGHGAHAGNETGGHGAGGCACGRH